MNPMLWKINGVMSTALKNTDFVTYFSREDHWGYILKPFKQRTRKLNSAGGIRFHQHHKPFIKAFNRI